VAEAPALDVVGLSIEHLATTLADLALLLVVYLAVGDAVHAVSPVVPRSVAHKKVLRGIVALDFIDVVYGLPLVQ